MYLIFKMVENDWVACKDKNGNEIRVKSKKEAFKRLKLLTLADKKENANCYRVFKMYNPYNV